MAGRPKKMAERVSRLEDRASELQLDVLRSIPRQYLERRDRRVDPQGLSQAWQDVGASVTEAYLALEHLGDILRDRAGIEEWEPGYKIDTPTPSDPACADKHADKSARGETQGNTQPKP